MAPFLPPRTVILFYTYFIFYLVSHSNANPFAMVCEVGLRALGPGVWAYKLMEVVVLYHHTRLHTPGYSVLIPRRTNTFSFAYFTFNAEDILNSLLATLCSLLSYSLLRVFLDYLSTFLS